MVRYIRQGIILTLLACFGGMMYLNALLLVANQNKIDDSSSYQDKLRKTEISKLISTNFNLDDKTDLNLDALNRKQKEIDLLSEEEIERQRRLSARNAGSRIKSPLIRSKIDGEHFSIDYLLRDSSVFSEKYQRSTLDAWKGNSCDGKWTIYRDFQKDPVVYSKSANNNIKCDVPCIGGHHSKPDIGPHSDPNCPHIKTSFGNMENVGFAKGIGNLKEIKGTTSLKSDVPLQYFNWDEFDFMKPPLNKTADGLVAAFISNCGPTNRLQYLQSLIDNGIEVHSYGKCMTNKKEPLTEVEKRHRSKLELGGTYKFIFCFENSETEDYISEKLFESIEAGVVPIYHGGPNPQRWAPANKSIVFADEYDSPAEVAELLKQLDSDDKLYNEYLQWKIDGPSKDFIAMIDLGIVHSDCRFCIRSADIDRMVIGEVVTGPYQQENELELEEYQYNDALLLKVRKRGKFWLKYIHLQVLTVAELEKRILKKFPDLGNIYKIYELWDRNKTAIITDEQVENLLYGHELEVIFEEPLSKERGRYSQWYYKKHGLDLDT